MSTCANNLVRGGNLLRPPAGRSRLNFIFVSRLNDGPRLAHQSAPQFPPREGVSNSRALLRLQLAHPKTQFASGKALIMAHIQHSGPQTGDLGHRTSFKPRV